MRAPYLLSHSLIGAFFFFIGSFTEAKESFRGREIVSERGRGLVRRVCKDISRIVGHNSQQLQLTVVDPGRPATVMQGCSVAPPPEPTQVSHGTEAAQGS